MVVNVTKDQCFGCQYWERKGGQPGVMPGVKDNYRRCLVQRMHKRQVDEWRGPTDWCNQFDATDDVKVVSRLHLS